MGSRQTPEDILVQTITNIYNKISNLPSLKPCKEVDMLFTELVTICIPPSNIDVTNLPNEVQSMRSNLIKLCATAEGLLESHYASLLTAFDDPLSHLNLFPYYTNYLKLSLLEYTTLKKHNLDASGATRMAFVGSGPLPLTSIVMANYYMKSVVFDNYDINPEANAMAVRLFRSRPSFLDRMVFHTVNIMDVTSALGDYDVVFLAALVGVVEEEKIQAIEHLAKHMAPGAMLMLRSANGARGFLYPVIEPKVLKGKFDVIDVVHPKDDVINSVVVARKIPRGDDIVRPC